MGALYCEQKGDGLAPFLVHRLSSGHALGGLQCIECLRFSLRFTEIPCWLHHGHRKQLHILRILFRRAGAKTEEGYHVGLHRDGGDALVPLYGRGREDDLRVDSSLPRTGVDRVLRRRCKANDFDRT